MPEKTEKTGRGFGLIEFTDLYKGKCSIQESSLAEIAALWIGVELQATETLEYIGKYSFVPSRMHITRNQAGELAKILRYFADHGELPKEHGNLRPVRE